MSTTTSNRTRKRAAATQGREPRSCAPAAGSPSAFDLALAACRSIRFAVTQAKRHGGEYSLHDILAADQLAQEAMTAAEHEAAHKMCSHANDSDIEEFSMAAEVYGKLCAANGSKANRWG